MSKNRGRVVKVGHTSYKEKELYEMISTALRERLDEKYVISKETNVLYSLIVNEKLDIEPSNYKEPSRGEFSFQVDLLVGESLEDDRVLPLVIIEIKKGQITTHDVITYSTKAQMHKKVYPYLRYGLLVFGEKAIPRRFFIHNAGFDFAYAMQEITNEEIDAFVRIIEDQIKNAKQIINSIKKNRKNKIKLYNSILEIR